MNEHAHSAGTGLTHRETIFIVFGVLLPVFMGSLDTTILASALPTIGREFGDVNNLPWLITAYLIANTAVTPLYGKISDIYGRKTTLLIAIGFYMLGSLVCALAPNMFVLILGRVLHGLGGGGLTSTGMVILGDIAAPRERGKYYGYFSATYTTAGACGPALGGFLSEYAHWSMIFWINIPMGLIAIGLALTLLRKLPRRERRHTLDFFGASLVMTASVAFMLALSMGGVRYGWTSTPILSLFAIAIVVGLGFVVRMVTAAEPLIPLPIFATAGARNVILANAFGWAGIVCLNIFLPIYLQSMLGMAATTAGLSVLVLSVSLNISAGISGFVVLRMVRYKLLPMIGLVISVSAILVLARWGQTLTFWQFECVLAIIGFGFGGLPPLSATMLQNNVASHQLGSGVGTMQFSRNLLSTILISVFGALVLVSGGAAYGSKPGVLEYSSEGFTLIFYCIAASMTVALIMLGITKPKPLMSTHA